MRVSDVQPVAILSAVFCKAVSIGIGSIGIGPILWYRYRLTNLVSEPVSVSDVWYRYQYRSVSIGFLIIIVSNFITDASIRKNLIRCIAELFQQLQLQKTNETRKHATCSCYCFNKRFRAGYFSFGHIQSLRALVFLILLQ